MPYYDQVPQPNQRISASQPQILANFQAIEAALGDDHVTFNTGAQIDWGKHNVVHLMNTPAPVPPIPYAPPAVGVAEIGMYNQIPAPGVPPQVDLFPLTGFQELFIYINNGGGHQVSVPITAKPAYQDSAVLGNANWFYLPCGMLVKYGISTTVGYTVILNIDAVGATDSVAYSAIPYVFVTNATINDQQTLTANAAIVAGATQLTVYSSGNDTPFYWFTIGPTVATIG